MLTPAARDGASDQTGGPGRGVSMGVEDAQEVGRMFRIRDQAEVSVLCSLNRASMSDVRRRPVGCLAL
ncbi:hypothetical protein [Nocardia beijingensis]|uniref:Uncharacterized protein n=1 Tax=Nocardia beijingensis TaxID=95162 RepID=A0ABW7WK30_9NOCA